MKKELRFIRTQLDVFNNLKDKDDNALYFIEDTHQIYKGSKLYSNNIKLQDKMPETGIEGRLYVNRASGSTKIWINGLGWINVVPDISNKITDDKTMHSIASSEAIKDYINEKIKPLIGQLTTDGIVLPENIKLAGFPGFKLGGLKEGDTLYKGTSLTEILRTIFQHRIPPTYIKPQLFTNINDENRYVEAGSKVKPAYEIEYQPNDGGDVTDYILYSIGNDGSRNEVLHKNMLVLYPAPEEQVIDGKSAIYEAMVYYGSGDPKYDNLGNEDLVGSLPGLVSTKFYYLGCRKMFVGNMSVYNEATSDIVRGFKSVLLGKPMDERIKNKYICHELKLPKESKIVIAIPEMEDNPHDYKVTVRRTTDQKDIQSKVRTGYFSIKGDNNYKGVDYKILMFDNTGEEEYSYDVYISGANYNGELTYSKFDDCFI